MDKIESLNINSEINQNFLFSLLKSCNSLTNLGIISKIRQFTQTNEFFSHYTNINAKNFDLFINKFLKKSNIFIKKISCIKEFEKFRIESDKYISFISTIIILYYMEIKLQKIINLISQKINKIISYCNSSLNDFNELQEKIYQLTETLNIKSNYSRISTKHNTLLLENDILTPKFIEFQDKEEDINTLKSNLFLSFVNKNENNKRNQLKRRDSYTSFSNLTFSSLKEESNSTKKINNSKPKKKNHIRATSVEKMSFPYVNLLHLSNEMFKKKIINSNEKIKLKELIISNDPRLISLCKCSTDRENNFFKIKKFLSEKN